LGQFEKAVKSNVPKNEPMNPIINIAEYTTEGAFASRGYKAVDFETVTYFMVIAKSSKKGNWMYL
tara:strand:- start:560 stop:754 length:195 start_codon:yes stop_codon:yes gene_type:complete